MKLKNLEYYPITKWKILLTEFTEEDFVGFMKIIEKIGFLRDLRMEEQINKLSNNPNLSEDETMKGSKSRIYISKEGTLDFLYIPRMNWISINFEHKKFGGEDFASLIFSN